MLPQAFTDRMQQMLGEEYPPFLRTFEEKNNQALRLNPLKGEKQHFLDLAPFSLTQVPWTEYGYYYEEKDRPGKHPWHEAGVYYIQEASAMAPAVFLEAAPGEKILDLCAAPGGKSTQIAADMKGQGILICNEIHPARAKILSENIERMGIRNALVLNHAPDVLAEHFPKYFDRILVDAPCSGEGMFRKNEEAASEWSQENVNLCAQRQDEILDYAAEMLAEGGRLVYSTCTFSPEENEGSISRFLKRHPEFFIVPVRSNRKNSMAETAAAGAVSAAEKAGMAAGRPEWTDRPAKGIEETLRLWPHKLKGEGHYLAVLEKDGVKGAGECTDRYGYEKGLSEKDCPEWLTFKKEALNCELSGVLLRFGEQVYLAPPYTPALKGLKVLRPGLHLGTLKKHRLEPAHALALALDSREAKQTLELPEGLKGAGDYLRGLTFPAQEKTGWYLLTADGYSLGWGKAAGGIMKNHYPKGLRRNWQ